MSYLHGKNIVHRDIKPENLIFLEKNNPESSLRLVDFGFATYLEPGHYLKEKHGTAYYIAPDVLNFHYDFKCDVWSTGVIMYIMLAGKPPFNGNGLNEQTDIQGKIKNGPKFRPRDFERDNVSQRGLSFLKRLMTFDQNERPTAEEALRDPWL